MPEVSFNFGTKRIVITTCMILNNLIQNHCSKPANHAKEATTIIKLEKYQLIGSWWLQDQVISTADQVRVGSAFMPLTRKGADVRACLVGDL